MCHVMENNSKHIFDGTYAEVIRMFGKESYCSVGGSAAGIFMNSGLYFLSSSVLHFFFLILKERFQKKKK